MIGVVTVALVSNRFSGGTDAFLRPGEDGGERQEADLTEDLQPIPRSPRVRAVDGAVEGSTTPFVGCSYFAPWRGQTCSSEGVVAFVGAMNTFKDLDLTCVPIEWWILSVFLHCDGRVALSDADLELIASHSLVRLPDPIAFSRFDFVTDADAEILPCFIDTLLGKNASDQEVGRVWAWGLTVVLGVKGDRWKAAPEVVAKLRILMANWPLGSEDWWKHLWNGLPRGSQMEALNLRVAIYETLHSLLPSAEWFRLMASLANLEGYDSVGSVALWSVGNVIRRLATNDEWAVAFGASDGAAWRRALIFAFPRELEWPRAGNGKVSSSIKDLMIELIHSDDYPHRGELLRKQWRLLGPEATLRDFENFVYLDDRNANDWAVSAGTRVMLAIRALVAHPEGEGQSPEWVARTEGLVNALMLASPKQDSRRILDVLKDRLVDELSTEEQRAWKEAFVRVLGPGWCQAQPASYGAWLRN